MIRYGLDGQIDVGDVAQLVEIIVIMLGQLEGFIAIFVSENLRGNLEDIDLIVIEGVQHLDPQGVILHALGLIVLEITLIEIEIKLAWVGLNVHIFIIGRDFTADQ